MAIDFSDICADRSHQLVHYDQDGYLKCDLDGKYVYADKRAICFTSIEDRKFYEERRRRLEAVFGLGVHTFDVR